MLRKCSNPQEQLLLKRVTPKREKRSRAAKKAEAAPKTDEKNGKVAEDKVDEANGKTEKNEDPIAPVKRPPRIRISLSTKTESRIPKKKKKGEDDDNKKDTEEVQPKRKRKLDDESPKTDKSRLKTPKKESQDGEDADRESNKTDAKGDGDAQPKEIISEEAEDPGLIYFNVDLLKHDREQLDGIFSSARENFIKRGPWNLPKPVENKFTDIVSISYLSHCLGTFCCLKPNHDQFLHSWNIMLLKMKNKQF